MGLDLPEDDRTRYLAPRKFLQAIWVFLFHLALSNPNPLLVFSTSLAYCMLLGFILFSLGILTTVSARNLTLFPALI